MGLEKDTGLEAIVGSWEKRWYITQYMLLFMGKNTPISKTSLGKKENKRKNTIHVHGYITRIERIMGSLGKRE